MAVECFMDELIFVIVTVPQDSNNELCLVVANEAGGIIKYKRVEMDNVADYLSDWLGLPLIRIVFVCTVLSGRNATVLRNYFDELGYNNINYNGIAYSSLTAAQFLHYRDENAIEVAHLFLDHLAIDNAGHMHDPSYHTNVYLSCTYERAHSFTIAAGTLEHGVQVAQQIHYTTDICGLLLPWFSKPRLYKIIIVSNFTSIDGLSRVECALSRHGLSLKNVEREEMKINPQAFQKFARVNEYWPGHLFAKVVLEEFIVQKRMQIIQ